MSTKYVTVNYNLTLGQQRKISAAVNNGTGVTLRLNKGGINPHSSFKLILTEKELQKLGDGGSHTVTLSPSRLKKGQTGGIFPLIPILAGLASAAGVAGGVSTAVANAKEARKHDAERKLIEEQQKSGKGLVYNKKKGRGLYLPNGPVAGVNRHFAGNG